MSLEVTIRKQAGSFRLQVSFTAKEEIFTILGASGCGKSMTLKCIAGIETPDEGRIVLNGKVLFDSEKKINLPPQKRNVGYMFQDYALFQNMTIEENIMAGMRQKKKEERRKKAASYIQTFHLDGLQGQYPHELSGGQKQRLAMARMMASEPDVILLDEPFAALDSYLKEKMVSEMRQELSERQCPVLFVTHNRDEAFALSHRICAMDSGGIDCIQEKDDFFVSPKTVSAAVLSGCKNISPIRRVDEKHVLAENWNLQLETNADMQQAQCVGIRAHNLKPCEMQQENAQHCLCTASDGEQHCGGMQQENVLHCVSYRVEESLFEWNIYLYFEGAKEEFLWKKPRNFFDTEETPEVPEYFTVNREHVLLLK